MLSPRATSRILAATLCAAGAFGPAGAARGEEERRTAALLPLVSSSGVTSDDVVLALEAALRRALAREPGILLQEEAVTRAALASAASLGLACDRRQVECAASLGSLLDVDLVLAPRLRGAGDLAALDLAAIDASSARLEKLASELLAFGPGERVAAVEALARRTLSEEGRPALLHLEVRPEGAATLLDGEPVQGRDSGAPLPIAAGRRVVEARAEGFNTRRVVVEAAPGEDVVLRLALEPASDGPVASEPLSSDEAASEPEAPGSEAALLADEGAQADAEPGLARYGLPTALVGAGLLVAGLAFGAYGAGSALELWRLDEEAKRSGSASFEVLARARDLREGALLGQVVGACGIALGAGVGLVGVGLWLFAPDEGEAALRSSPPSPGT